MNWSLHAGLEGPPVQYASGVRKRGEQCGDKIATSRLTAISQGPAAYKAFNAASRPDATQAAPHTGMIGASNALAHAQRKQGEVAERPANPLG
jgi:hypothetical protein